MTRKKKTLGTSNIRLAYFMCSGAIFVILYDTLRSINFTVDEKPSDGEFWLPQQNQNHNLVATFKAITDSLPGNSIDGTEYPRGTNERSYMGVGVWNGRVSLSRAIMAMMGSPSAYVETPLFTACRLQLQYGPDNEGLAAAMRRELYPTSEMRRDFMGYYKFVHEFQSIVNCTHRSRKFDEVNAAVVAQSIIDSRLSNNSELEVIAWSHSKYLNHNPTEEPSNLLYSTVYPYVAAQYYGPSIVVLDPDKRGLDLGYFTSVQKDKDRGGGGVMNSCTSLNKEDPADGGEMITPGYKSPKTVVGFEIRRKGSYGDKIRVNTVLPARISGKEVPSITHAFYKESIPKFGDVVFMLNFPPGTVHCIKSSYNSNHRPGSFFECSSGGHVMKSSKTHHCMGKDDGNFTEKPLKVTGIIFSGGFQRSCESADLVLRNLLPEHQGFGADTSFLNSQTFQNVLSSVTSKIRKKLFFAHFVGSDKVSCTEVIAGQGENSLWQSHREVASSQIGLDTQYTTCIARLPPFWVHDGSTWNATVSHLKQSNPLERDVFTHEVMENSHLLDVPNYLWLLGGDIPLKDACYGYKGSICIVNLTSNRAHVKHRCHLECTHARSWFAYPDDPLNCHFFSRDMITTIARNAEKLQFRHIATAHHSFQKQDVRYLSQSELDPLQWPPKYKGSLNIVSSSDLHGFIHGRCQGLFCSYGASSMASLLQTIRLSSSITRDPVLVLDAGDAIFGSGIPTKNIISTMNVLGYDAMTLGNHDLDIGLDRFSYFAHEAQFPILATNLNVRGVPLRRHFFKSIIIGGESINVCIVGLTTPEQNPLLKDSLSFIHNSTEEFLTELLQSARSFRCDVQILLSHLGYKQDARIATLAEYHHKSERFLDLIIGGHSHVVFGSSLSKTNALEEFDNDILMEPFPTIRGGTPIAHSGSNGMYCGLFTVESDASKKIVVHGELKALVVEEGVFPDKRMSVLPNLKIQFNTTIQINSNVPMCSISCRKRECMLGNFVSNAMRECLLDSSCRGGGLMVHTHPLIALLESGTIRGCLSSELVDLSEIIPWPNKLVVMTVNGATIRSLLQHGLDTKLNMQGGGFLQTSGLWYRYKNNRVLGMWQFEPTMEYMHQETAFPTGSSITFETNTSPPVLLTADSVHDDQLYDIVVTDWLAAGGDGFASILENHHGDSRYINTTVQEALYHYSSKRPIIKRELRSLDVENMGPHESVVHSLAALLGSFAAAIFSYPLYTLSVLRATSSNINKRGFRLHDGAVTAAIAGALSNSIFFFIFNVNVIDFSNPYARSIFAAVVNVLITNPMWVVVTRLQTAKYKMSFVSSVKSILRDEGLRGLFDGFSMNMVMIIYPTIRQLGLNVMFSYFDHFTSIHAAKGLCGSVASCFATIVTYPIQRWRLQLQAGSACTFVGVFDGLGYKIVHSGLTNFILFAIMSQSEELLDYIFTG